MVCLPGESSFRYMLMTCALFYVHYPSINFLKSRIFKHSVYYFLEACFLIRIFCSNLSAP